jgi:hypothetical protein
MSLVFDGITFQSAEARSYFISMDEPGRAKWRTEHATMKPPPQTDIVAERSTPHAHVLSMQAVQPGPGNGSTMCDERAIKHRYFPGGRQRRGFRFSRDVDGDMQVEHRLFDDTEIAVTVVTEKLQLGFEVQTDTDVAVEFMRRWPTERMHIWAKIPDGKIESRTFDRTPDAYAAMRSWIDARQGASNLYFVVNDIGVALGIDKRGGKTVLTPLETDVVRMIATQVDSDPRPLPNATPEKQIAHYAEEERRLLDSYEAHDPRFNVVLFSGGGTQGFQLFRHPIEVNGDPSRIAEAKRLNLHLKRVQDGADDCESLQHVMRLPGTSNLPDGKKLKRGRKPAFARSVRFDDRSLWHDVGSLTKAELVPREDLNPIFVGADKYEPIKPDDVELRELDQKWIDLGVSGDIGGKYVVDGKLDRSRALFAFVTACMQMGIRAEVIARCLMDSSWRIGECIRDKGSNSPRHLRRTIDRAREFVQSSKLAEMNAAHHVVNLGGKTLVLTWDFEDEIYPGRPIATYRTPAEFCKFYNKWNYAYTDKDGVLKSVPLGTWWWKSGGRRQYSGIVYAPHVNDDVVGGKLNLWRGFTVASEEGDCSLYLGHLRDNICVDEYGKPVLEYFDYLIGWMAYAVQHPERQGQVAWVMIGKKGVGKTVAAEEFGKSFGFHYVAITNPDHMTGRFNQHLQSCSVLLADECFFAADRKHEQILKTLITGDRVFIEPKGVNAYQVKNYLHVVMCTNNAWAVPASHDERRYFVLKVGDAYIQDIAYFKAICSQMDDGGRAALLRMLLNLDLSKHTVGGKPFEIRRAPTTDALRDQQARSRQGVDALVEDMLVESHVMFSHTNMPNVCITSGKEDGKGFDHYIETQAPMGLRYLGPGRVKNALKKEWGCEHFRGRIAGKIVAGIAFPPLPEMRAMFEERHGDVGWPGTKDQQWEADNAEIPF